MHHALTTDELLDALTIGLIIIAAFCAFFYWLADLMDKQDQAAAQRQPMDLITQLHLAAQTDPDVAEMLRVSKLK